MTLHENDLYDVHQDTKPAGLIAVCERTLKQIDKFVV